MSRISCRSLIGASAEIEHQMSRLVRFVNFAVLIYVPWWFRYPISADAPINDLQLTPDIQTYEQIDNQIANSALKAI